MMIYRTKFKIGEFSKLMQVTIKTLRLYEQKGLLQPDEVDENSGYRYYKLSGMQRLVAIRNLQKMGFSLSEIKEIFDSETHTPSLEQLDEKIIDCEQQLNMLQGKLQFLLSMRDLRKRINDMEKEKFSIQALPSIIVASHREVLKSYQDLGAMCIDTVGPEMLRLGCRCSEPGYCFTIEHNKEYSSTNLDIEYCEQVEEIGTDSAIVQFKRLDEVPMAVCMSHYGPYDLFYESYAKIYHYIEENGYKVAGMTRVSYIDGAWNQDDPEKWLSIFQVPVTLDK